MWKPARFALANKFQAIAAQVGTRFLGVCSSALSNVWTSWSWTSYFFVVKLISGWETSPRCQTGTRSRKRCIGAAFIASSPGHRGGIRMAFRHLSARLMPGFKLAWTLTTFECLRNLRSCGTSACWHADFLAPSEAMEFFLPFSIMTSSQLYKWCGAYNRDGEEYKVAKNFLFLRFCVDVTCCCKWSRPDYFFSCMCACCWHRSNVLTCRASKQSFFSPVCRAWNFRKPHSKDLSLSSVALMWNFGDVIQWVDMCGSQVTRNRSAKRIANHDCHDS